MVSTVESTPATTGIVTGHADCRAVLRDSARFPAGSGQETEAAHRRRHHAYQALAPKRRSATLEPEMRRLAALMVNELAPGRIDLVCQLAAPFADAVLDAYFGLPQPAWHDYHQRWLEDLRPREERGPRAELIRTLQLRQARTTFIHALQVELEDRRREPRNDVLTAMAHAADEHDGYTDADTLRIIPTLANNALLGLTDLAGTVLWQILTHPSPAGEIASDEHALAGAIEEILRLEPPVQSVQRRAAVPVEVDGEHIPAGAPVRVRLAAANRDEAVFADPDRLDPHRPNAANHLSFGHGQDFCIGAPLVRRAAAILASAFLERMPAIRLVDDAPIEHWSNPFNRGLRRLDVFISE